MSVTRINEFQAREGEAEALSELIRSFLPRIEGSAGCRSCQLLQSQENPARLVVIEVWDNVAAHQASVQSVPPETFQEAMKLLAGPPSGEYFDG
jgi:quinol monooxygenase YgiN